MLEQDNLDITHSTVNYGFVPDLVDGTLSTCVLSLMGSLCGGLISMKKVAPT